MNDTETQLREALEKLYDACRTEPLWSNKLTEACLHAGEALRRTEPKPEAPKHPAVEAYDAHCQRVHYPYLRDDKGLWLQACKWAWRYAADTQCEPSTIVWSRLRKLAEGI